MGGEDFVTCSVCKTKKEFGVRMDVPGYYNFIMCDKCFYKGKLEIANQKINKYKMLRELETMIKLEISELEEDS